MPTTVRAVSDISPPVAGRTNGYADRGIQNNAPGSRMTYSRLIGALFLVGFLFYGVGAALVTSVTGAPDFLSTISAHQTTLVIGAFLMLLNTVVDVGKGVLFFPILENHGKRSALAYLAFIIVQVVMLDAGVLALLLIVPLGQQAMDAGQASAAWAQPLGSLLTQWSDPVEHHGLFHRRGNARSRGLVPVFAAVPDAADPPLSGGWRPYRLRESHGGNDR